MILAANAALCNVLLRSVDESSCPQHASTHARPVLFAYARPAPTLIFLLRVRGVIKRRRAQTKKMRSGWVVGEVYVALQRSLRIQAGFSISTTRVPADWRGDGGGCAACCLFACFGRRFFEKSCLPQLHCSENPICMRCRLRMRQGLTSNRIWTHVLKGRRLRCNGCFSSCYTAAAALTK